MRTEGPLEIERNMDIGILETDILIDALRLNHRKQAQDGPHNHGRIFCAQCHDCEWFCNAPTWKLAKQVAREHGAEKGHTSDATLVDERTGEQTWILYCGEL